MKTTRGIDLRHAAKDLRISDFALRNELKQMGAIRKTVFGWVAKEEYQARGLLTTDTRQTTIHTEQGHPIKKDYTVVLVTGPGLDWLRNRINHKKEQHHAIQ